MTNIRSPQSQALFHAGLSALVQGLQSRQLQGVAGFGQLDPTQEIALGSVEQRNNSYDPAGRRTRVSGAENATFGYDWRNQPTRTTDNASSIKTTYDGLGRPVSRETELLGLAIGHPIAIASGIVIGYVAALGSTAIDCIAALASPKCVVGAIGAATGPFATIITSLPKHTNLVTVVVKNTASIVGYETTALGWLITFGEWYEGE
ncbi:hypothetical protein QBL02_13765 [Leucobacter sp. UT-8R-CII-1-4]|uniref:hypothetical protein n=1 Tax=Leucobacter sp. UT-8R-CII-1-4 TaxID=3040075 RepID=UPI0024A7EE59|nr:hypothetical protein [Leucobacter sp. UT-8R-CII-1-4]MDI6024604.1 hypothetical protein [Leucobacter sp. UT-8R-CII-1-4]